MHLPKHLVFGFSLVLVLACGDDSQKAVDAGADLAADLATDGGSDGGVPLNLATGGNGASDVAAVLTAGAVRAGKVTQSSELLSGIKVEGRVGDFKIYNDLVAFIIAGNRTTDGYSPYGGELLDAMLLGQTGATGNSLLGETILAAKIHVVKPTSVGVVSDGSDGKEALVRVIGKPALFPYFGALLGPTFGGDLNMYLVVDYVLKPGSRVLEIRWRFFNASKAEQEAPMLLVAQTTGDGAELFAEGMGFDFQTLTSLDYVGLVGSGISYAMVSLEKPLQPLIEKSGVWVNSLDGVKLAGSAEATRTLYFVVAEGEPEAVRRAVRALKKETGYTMVSGVVKDGAAVAVVGARIHVERDETKTTYETMTRSDAKGNYKLELKPGKYRVTVVADGRVPKVQLPVTVSAATLVRDLTTGATASIEYTVTDDSGGAIPAKVVAIPKTAPLALSSSFGEAQLPDKAAAIHFSTGGKGTLALPPDEYTVHISRGYEYEVSKSTVTLADGDKKSVTAVLKRSVDTTGYMCGDFHLHSMWSPDSSDLIDFKLSTLAAAGVELPVATDHEYITDYNPYIATLGLQKWMYGVIGEELTTLLYGHFNPFPLTQDSSKPNMGAMSWFNKTPPQLFADVRKTWPDAVFQINHPRSSKVSGYLENVEYDAKTGTVKNSSYWSKSFDAMEVCNGSSYDSNKDRSVKDWFSFLDRGFLVTGTGNSDSHHALKSQVGYPRNYVKLSSDEPGKVSLSEFTKAVKQQKVLVSGGPFVTVAAGSKGMGEVVDAKSKSVKLAIKVQAPTWMAADTLKVIMGGAEVKSITLDSTTADPKNPVVRYDNTVDLTPTKDTWVVVVVTGAGTLAPVVNGTPFAITNPIYLDVDGNGVYDPPLSW